jgi:SNF2 family DNA or RNA helicase
VNAINLIAKNSIEEKVYAGINLKQELFGGVFDGTTDQVEFSREKKAEFINKIREMLGEEKIIAAKRSVSEELPDSTPHFLNPKALQDRELNMEDLAELEEDEDQENSFTEPGHKGKGGENVQSAISENPRDYAKMEEVLNQGMQFINGLMSMATGKPLMPDAESGKENKSISVDKETGEVIMKFKLPGF